MDQGNWPARRRGLRARILNIRGHALANQPNRPLAADGGNGNNPDGAPGGRELLPGIVLGNGAQARNLNQREPILQHESDSEDDDYPLARGAGTSPRDTDDDWPSSEDYDDDNRTRRLSYLRFAISVNKQRQSLKPTYAFRPFRLIRRNFKRRNAPSDFPIARSGHRIIANESHLYCLGGYNPRWAQAQARYGQCVLFQELWSYNFATNRWHLMLNAQCAPRMPRELASNAMEMYNGFLITHGGTGFPFGDRCSNACIIYTTGNKPIVYPLKVDGELPLPQYGPGTCIHNDYLYTIGGTTGYEYTCDVYRLDLRTNVWEQLYVCRPDMRDDPEGRYRHEVVCDKKYIYILGGGTSNSVYDLQKLPAFDMENKRWEYFYTLPDRSVPQTSTATHNAGFPRPRKCFSCISHTTDTGDVEAIITGGVQVQGEYNNYFNDVWRLNFTTKQWTLVRSAELPKTLHFHAATYNKVGCMYIFGGIEYTDKEMRRRNDLYKMWVKIPKLSEMCWDAITYYNDKLNDYDANTLLQTGIPQCYLDRLPNLLRFKHANDAESFEASGSKRLRSLSG